MDVGRIHIWLELVVPACIARTHCHIPIPTLIPRNSPPAKWHQQYEWTKLRELAELYKCLAPCGAQNNKGRALAVPGLLAVKALPY